MKIRFFSVSLVTLLLNLSAWLPTMTAATDRTNVASAPYNAIPNDGLDDTAAINAALTAPTPTPAPGSTPSRSIYFPPGTYIYKGPMKLATFVSFRLYGDGPGVSKILFQIDPLHPGDAPGISAPKMGQNTLNVEGLTLQADCSPVEQSPPVACGTAISAKFSETGASTKFRTAVIQNVEIRGNLKDSNSGSYWTHGIYLYMAQNAVIDKVEIDGNIRTTPTGDDDASLTGITWESSPGYLTTGLQMSAIVIKFVNTAVRTSGWVEGLYLTGFEFVQCGQHGMPAIDLASSDSNGLLESANRKPTFHLVNGHVDIIQNGIQLTHLRDIKITKVDLAHNGGAEKDGSMVIFNNCFDATVSQCTFYGGSPVRLSDECAIRLNDAHYVQISGHYFTNMLTSTGCIVTQSSSNIVRITNNLFIGVTNKYDDQNLDPNDPYLRGNYPAP